jgi:hypothetical protein
MNTKDFVSWLSSNLQVTPGNQVSRLSTVPEASPPGALRQLAVPVPPARVTGPLPAVPLPSVVFSGALSAQAPPSYVSSWEISILGIAILSPWLRVTSDPSHVWTEESGSILTNTLIVLTASMRRVQARACLQLMELHHQRIPVNGYHKKSWY